MEKKELGAIREEVEIGGRVIKFETGRLGKLASGSCVATINESIILANVVIKPSEEERDFFPLTIDFEDKWYATGKISGSRFIKREGRPSELAVLRSRMIDRPIRPMFPKGYMEEIQIIVTPLSLDELIDPAVIGINVASAALMLSGAPFEGPIAAVRIGKVNGKLVINPSYQEMKESTLDILVAGTKESITMVEAGAKEESETTVIEALSVAHDEIKKLAEAQVKLRAKLKVKEKEFSIKNADNGIFELVSESLKDKLGAAIRHADKMARRDIIADLEDFIIEKFKDDYEEDELKLVFDEVIKKEVRRAILEDGIRPDGRQPDEIRPLSAETSLLPRTHGSAIFERGTTQVLSITTLGSPSKALIVDSMDQDFEKRFMHHYNDAPFAYGEVGRLGPGRRAIGHGNLAEKALEAVMPEQSEFPYTIRVVSEIMSCNGSSSMASICGSSLSLMDAGVPIKRHVAGIAMGLITKDGSLKDKHVILTDIQAAEDFAGDMDFKCSGTRGGITALQMDIKVKGLTIDFLKKVLIKARVAHGIILEVMEKCISEPKKSLSKYAPRLTTLHINPDKIRDVIGKGGETINKIIAETNVEIDINDEGTVTIAAVNGSDAEKAIEWIKSLTALPEVGKVYKSKVVKIMDFGAFVEYMPGHQGLVHISQLAKERVNKVEDVVKTGDLLEVKLTGIDDQGRANLSHKVLEK